MRPCRTPPTASARRPRTAGAGPRPKPSRRRAISAWISSTVISSPAGRPSTIDDERLPVRLAGRQKPKHRARLPIRSPQPRCQFGLGRGTQQRRIGATGRSTARCWRTAWWTSIPSPSTVTAPTAAAARSSAVSSGWYTMSATVRSTVEQARVERRLVAAHADRGGVDQHVGGGDVVERARPAPSAPGAPPARARAASRLTIAMSATAVPTEGVDDRPGRRPGAEHDDSPRRRASTPDASSESTKPAPSVDAPNVDPSSRSTTVFTDTQRRGRRRRPRRPPPRRRTCAAW